MNNNVKAYRNYRDRLFRFYFNDKGRLIELYNALYDTDIKDEGDIDINTLDSAVYLTYKNDISFIVQVVRFVLTEQQSTVNPNMPLRDMVYYTTMLEKYMIDKSMYSDMMLEIPRPVFIVFYNGSRIMPERKLL